MEAKLRHAARVIVVAPDDRVLLLRTTYQEGGRLWITPGGGVEHGESLTEAAIREMREETGIEATLGPCVWVRRHVFEFRGAALDEREHFFVVPLDHHPTTTDANLMDEERNFVHEYRWWSVHEIAASRDWFAPRRMKDLLPAVIAGDYPPAPINCGV